MRKAQLERLSPSDVGAVLIRIRARNAISKLQYHFRVHGEEVGARTPEQYVELMMMHLQRGDLRIFSYLQRKARGTEVFWALVAPDDATTVVYNETRGVMHSFYRPAAPDVRMRAVMSEWIEVVRQGQTWRSEEAWTWTT